MKVIPFRYLPWMARDLLTTQGAVLAAVGVMAWLIAREVEGASASDGPRFVAMAVQQLALLFLLYVAAAIVSHDRVHGYYRGFFSRPISPAGYYFSRWLLGGLVFLLIGPVFTLALSLAIGWFPLSRAVLIQLALNYLLLGGLVFMFSAFTRGDWLFGLLFFMVENVLTGLRKAEIDLPAIWDFVLKILPPFSLASVTAPVPSGADLLHVILYGSGLVVAALLLLRWRPLGAGGRS